MRIVKGSCALAAAFFALAFATACEKEPAGCVPEVKISGNHGHAVEIPAEHVGHDKAEAYSVGGDADHKHAMALRGPQLKSLSSGQKIETRTTSVRAHAHQLVVSCP